MSREWLVLEPHGPIDPAVAMLDTVDHAGRPSVQCREGVPRVYSEGQGQYRARASIRPGPVQSQG